MPLKVSVVVALGALMIVGAYKPLQAQSLDIPSASSVTIEKPTTAASILDSLLRPRSAKKSTTAPKRKIARIRRTKSQDGPRTPWAVGVFR